MDFRKVRMFLELRQVDVAAASEISISRLSQAERGLTVLNRVEQASLESFLRARLQEEFARTSRKLAQAVGETLESPDDDGKPELRTHRVDETREKENPKSRESVR
jgi:transcriptional regulator with XRE-family HTH domain